MRRYSEERRPILFISYSWTSAELQNWVIDLATVLRTEWGIDVILDVWEMKAGNDMNHFMEESVRTADKVLVICDRGYQTKADTRCSSGVSTETQIISPEVYADAKQEKFIPVFYEKDENGTPFIPMYLRTRLGFDLSNARTLKDDIRKLAENIYEVSRKPEIGALPKFDVAPFSNGVLPEQSRDVFNDDPIERIIWLLPRGFLFIADITFQNDPDWSVVTDFVKYSGEPMLGMHYKPEYREYWSDYDKLFRNLRIPRTDWHLDEYYPAVRFVRELREYKGQKDLKAVVQEKRVHKHHVYYYGPGEPIYLPEVPEEFKVLFETGKLRDIQENLRSLREGKPEKLISKADALRYELRVSAHKYFADDPHTLSAVSDVINDFDSKSTNEEMNEWLDRAIAVLGTALDLVLGNAGY